MTCSCCFAGQPENTKLVDDNSASVTKLAKYCPGFGSVASQPAEEVFLKIIELDLIRFDSPETIHSSSSPVKTIVIVIIAMAIKVIQCTHRDSLSCVDKTIPHTFHHPQFPKGAANLESSSSWQAPPSLCLLRSPSSNIILRNGQPLPFTLL